MRRPRWPERRLLAPVNWLGAFLQYGTAAGALGAAAWMVFFDEQQVVVMTPAGWVLFGCLAAAAVLSYL